MRNIDEKFKRRSARAIERVRHQALQASRMWWTNPPEWTRAEAPPKTALEPTAGLLGQHSRRESPQSES